MTKPAHTESRFIAERVRPLAALELTFSTANRRDILTRDRWLETLAASVDRVLKKNRLALHAFVFLPDCVRLVIEPPGPDARLPWMLFAMKRGLSHKIRTDLQEAKSELLRELTVRHGRGRYVFQVWEPGPGQIVELASSTDVTATVDSIHSAPVLRGLCESSAGWRWSSRRCYDNPDTAPPVAILHVTPWRRAATVESGARREAVST
jgi:REP element-mobilizing transposase RayT